MCRIQYFKYKYINRNSSNSKHQGAYFDKNYMQVYTLLCCRYIDGSTKQITRCARENGMSKVFKLKSTSRLPAAKLLFSVAANKVQVIDYIIEDLLNHKDDEMTHSLTLTGPDPTPCELSGGTVIRRQDLRTTQEEGDTIILHQVNRRTSSCSKCSIWHYIILPYFIIPTCLSFPGC